jgi:hypothetical protein
MIGKDASPLLLCREKSLQQPRLTELLCAVNKSLFELAFQPSAWVVLSSDCSRVSSHIPLSINIQINDMAEYTGPMPGEMIRSHTLAAEIIARHHDACPILGSSELTLLRRFCADPSAKEAVLRDRDMLDEPGDWPGKKAQSKHGSLAGFAIARHGTETPALQDREIEMLKKWFESGAVDARIDGTDGRSDLHA